MNFEMSMILKYVLFHSNTFNFIKFTLNIEVINVGC